MTVDLRVPNSSMKATAWPMPNLQNELHNLHGSEVFATLDFCQGYWQIPLHKDSQDCQSFITPDGVYTPSRVLHGTRNATQHLQSMLVVMMDDIKSNIKVWLDACLLHTKTEDDLLATLNFFFKKCQEHGLKLHARKCVLYASTVRYCGRLITKDGVRFDRKNMEALQTMLQPQNGADLVQYVAAVNWMRSAITNYSKRVAPREAALAKVIEGKSRRTKKAAAAVSPPCCTQVAALGTQDIGVLLPHGARDGRAQLLDRPHDKMGSRVGSRQREQSAWQDGQPVCTAVHQPAGQRYRGVSIGEEYSTGVE
jgi:Reverse transcriptase (RNA-dependent DNA polymerase)